MDAGAIIALGASAVIMAIEQALRAAPDFRARLPRILASENWEIAPLILLIVAGMIWATRLWQEPKFAGPLIPSTQPVAQETAIPQSSPTLYQYHNELSVPQVFDLTDRMAGTFRQSAPLVFVITAPPESDAFKNDFYAIVVHACNELTDLRNPCSIEPVPDPRIVVDTGIPEPRFPGIVIHAADSMPNLLGTMLTQYVGSCFVVHKSNDIPEAIKRLNPFHDNRTLVWFELGRGSPYR